MPLTGFGDRRRWRWSVDRQKGARSDVTDADDAVAEPLQVVDGPVEAQRPRRRPRIPERSHFETSNH